MQNRKRRRIIITRYIPLPFLEAGFLILLALIASHYGKVRSFEALIGREITFADQLAASMAGRSVSRKTRWVTGPAIRNNTMP